MIISLTTRNPCGEKRHFTCKLNTLEASLETVNALVTTGDTLLRVHLIEGNNVLSLPVEAFDGQPMEEPIAGLKKEWQGILQKPVNLKSVQQQYLISRNRAHRSRHQAYIDRLKEAIGKTEQQLSHFQNVAFDQSGQARLWGQLTSTLQQYQRQLAVAINREELILDEFTKLQGR